MNVYLLLDRSGSMSSLWSEAIGAINGYVNNLKKKDYVHLAVFDSTSYDVVRDVKVEDWVDIDSDEIKPGGTTPLYDSCAKIMQTAEDDNAKKTVLVVMTDGYENASKEHTQASIKAKVKMFEDKKWEVIFLGANFDAVESVSGALGVVGSKSMNISAGNLRDAMSVVSGYTGTYGATGQAINFSAQDKLKAVSPK